MDETKIEANAVVDLSPTTLEMFSIAGKKLENW